MSAGPQHTVTIPSGDILVRNRLRRLNPTRLRRIVDSIAEIGLQTPISVMRDEAGEYVLVAGLHRLTACRKLGHTEIAAVVIELDEIARQIWEIDENLARAELTAAQEGFCLRKRKELWELRNNTGASCAGNRGRGRPKKFAAETAKQTGKNKATRPFPKSIGW